MGRQVKELVEFFTIKSVRDGELQGRVSGDLAWRLLRGETKPQEDEYKVSLMIVVYPLPTPKDYFNITGMLVGNFDKDPYRLRVT